MNARNAKQQSGATLVVALLMMLVLTLMGVTAAQMALFDEKGARAARDHDLGLQGAEAALRDAMVDIDSGLRGTAFAHAPVGFDDGCPAVGLPTDITAAVSNRRGLCLARAPEDSRQSWQDVDLGSRGVPFGTFTQRAWDNSVTDAPLYMIESMPLRRAGSAVEGTSGSSDQLAFRITAVGYGPSGSGVEVALQSYYVRNQ